MLSTVLNTTKRTVSQELGRTSYPTTMTWINNGASFLTALTAYIVLMFFSHTFALGRQADVILANAKRKLNVCRPRLVLDRAFARLT